MTVLNSSLWVHPSVKYLENNRAKSSFGFYNTPATNYAIFTVNVSIGHLILNYQSILDVLVSKYKSNTLH